MPKRFVLVFQPDRAFLGAVDCTFNAQLYALNVRFASLPLSARGAIFYFPHTIFT